MQLVFEVFVFLLFLGKKVEGEDVQHSIGEWNIELMKVTATQGTELCNIGGIRRVTVCGKEKFKCVWNK